MTYPYIKPTRPSDGLNKLMEELAELAQVAAKQNAYYNTDVHPDGKGSLKERMTEEMGDVLAAMHFVATKRGMDLDAIIARAQMKLGLYKIWDENNDI